MSRNDHDRGADTAMAEAFRKAGIDTPDAKSLRPASKASSDLSPRSIVLRLNRHTPPGTFGSGNLPQLDLHGRNEDQAYAELEEFIAKRHDEGHRTVLIITGKGSVKGSGKLRRLVHHWLETPPFEKFVVGTQVAEPWRGGDGARYVRLRERRTGNA